MWLNFAACAFCCLCSTTPPYARLAIASFAHSGICSEICNHVNDFVLSLVGGCAKRAHGNCQKQKCLETVKSRGWCASVSQQTT